MVTENYSQIDFEGKDFFVGIDTGKKDWKVNIRAEEMELKRESIDPKPHTLYRYLKKRYPGGTYHTVYEASYCGFWIHREFEKMGVDSIVVNAADVPTSDKEKDRKTDPVDARKLAHELEKGGLTGIYIPSEEDQNLRSLARHLRKSVQSATRVKNRIRAHAYFNGILIPEEHTAWSNAFIRWLETLPMDNGPARESMQYYLEELREHKTRTLSIIRSLRKYCNERGVSGLIKRLRTTPGIGLRSALVLYTEIIDMKRFSTYDKLKTFVGLIPSKDSSGDVDKDRGVTKRRNRYLRHVLIEASWVAVRRDPAMLAYYSTLKRRMKKQEAIIRVAKKLLSRIRSIWLNGTEYMCSIK